MPCSRKTPLLVGLCHNRGSAYVPTLPKLLTWQVDRKWQVKEPGQCRAVLSAPLVRAIVALAPLWNWSTFATAVSLGFSGMLHPSEFASLLRSDLVFPEDTLEPRGCLYIHICNPKTARLQDDSV